MTNKTINGVTININIDDIIFNLIKQKLENQLSSINYNLFSEYDKLLQKPQIIPNNITQIQVPKFDTNDKDSAKKIIITLAFKKQLTYLYLYSKNKQNTDNSQQVLNKVKNLLKIQGYQNSQIDNKDINTLLEQLNQKITDNSELLKQALEFSDLLGQEDTEGI